ncbi:MAG: ABC transporter ATP-binding protein [Limnohabitans sp.]
MNSDSSMTPIESKAQHLLRLRNVSFSYLEGVETLQNINLDLAPGEFHCLLGRSGCGKTSLLKLAAGLLSAQQGEVVWNNQPLITPQSDMGFVFQRPTLLEWLDVLDNVLLPIALHRRIEASDLQKAKELLQRMGLAHKFHGKPTELSGGQQSRVAIARALITSPHILFMDEPFASLDAITREELQHDLMAICAEHKTSILFVTHDIGEAVYLGNQVSVMAQGKIHHTLAIDLPQPRQNSMRHSPEFNHFSAKLRHAMEVVA